MDFGLTFFADAFLTGVFVGEVEMDVLERVERADMVVSVTVPRVTSHAELCLRDDIIHPRSVPGRRVLGRILNLNSNLSWSVPQLDTSSMD